MISAMTGQQVVALFHHDAAALVVGVALCTIAIGLLLFALLGGTEGETEFVLTGLFAAAYGFRLLVGTDAVDLLLGQPAWLPYLQSSLEYLVPIPGVALFTHYAPLRWKVLNVGITLLLAFCAAVLIPYELLTHAPFAAVRVINTLIGVLLCVFLVNIVTWTSDPLRDWRLVRFGAVVFVLFVANAHLQLVSDRFGLSREPVGFLIFILTIVIATMRDSITGARRLALVDGELTSARKIQQSILPRGTPQRPGLEVAAIFTPASDVAGDFYEFIQLPDGRLGLFIADVSGHGIPAALVASMLKVALATQEAFAGSPAMLMAEMNRLFCGKLERQFISAAYVCISAELDSLTTASAGGPPPLLFRAEGSIEELLVPGVILGRFRDARFHELTTSFGPGDSLLLYTDGVTETRDSAKTIWGEERLRDVLAESATQSAAALLTTITGELARWTSSPTPDDDVTLIAVKRA